MMIGDGNQRTRLISGQGMGVADGVGTCGARDADAAILPRPGGQMYPPKSFARPRGRGKEWAYPAGTLHSSWTKGHFLVTTMLGVTGLVARILADTGGTVLVNVERAGSAVSPANVVMGFGPTPGRTQPIYHIFEPSEGHDYDPHRRSLSRRTASFAPPHLRHG